MASIYHTPVTNANELFTRGANVRQTQLCHDETAFLAPSTHRHRRVDLTGWVCFHRVQLKQHFGLHEKTFTHDYTDARNISLGGVLYGQSTLKFAGYARKVEM
jgi:hypothetical protein